MMAALCVLMVNARCVCKLGWSVGGRGVGVEAEGCPEHLGKAEGRGDRARGPHPDDLLPCPGSRPKSPLQGAHVRPQLPFLLLLLLFQLKGLRWSLCPDSWFQGVLKPVLPHVGISTLDLVKYPAESAEDMGQSRGKVG